MTDPLLNTLVSTINNNDDGTSIGVTLTTKGLVISGFIIPATVWRGAVQEQIIATEGKTTGFSEFFRGSKEPIEQRAKDRKTWDSLKDQLPESYLRAGDDVDDVRYICLKGAQFYGAGINGKQIPGSDGCYWRGDLRSVDGWTPGTFSV